MIYPERMDRISIVAPKKHLKKVIEVLHGHSVLHIVNHRKENVDIGAPLTESAALSEQVIKIRSLIHTLKIEMDDEPREVPSGDIGEQVDNITRALAAVDEEDKRIAHKIRELQTKNDSPQKEHEMAAVERSKENNIAARERLIEGSKEFLLSAEKFLSTQSRKAQAPLRFAVSKSAFLVSGWVPHKNYTQLSLALEKETAGEIHLERLQVKEDAPIKLDNRKAVKPYELLLRLYTLPKYHEIDPSFFIFISFPIFFGFIVGDIGYGLVYLTIGLLIKKLAKHRKVLAAASNILIAGAISTMLFGYFYGEMFGLEHIGPLELHPVIHRAYDVMSLLMLALGVGIAHITVALLTGFILEWRHHGFWKGFTAKASWILLLIAAGMIAAGVFGVGGASEITWLKTAGFVLGAISIILIIIGEGARGAIELPGIFSNIASYARLMAVGVASAGLAIVVNELAGSLFSAGGVFGILMGLFVIIIGHIINMALGLLGSFIHGLRLNYVEFFSKFYEGGGKPYQPFGSEDTN